MSFPLGSLALNPAASTPKSFTESDFYTKTNIDNSLFVRGGVPTDLVLTNRPSEDFVHVEAIEIRDGESAGVCSTLSVWRKAATDDFSVGGFGVEAVFLFGRCYVDGGAPSPFGSKSHYFDPSIDADLVIQSIPQDKEPAAHRFDGMLADISIELSVRVAANLRKQAEGKAQAEINRKAREAERQAAALKEIEDARMAAEAAEKAKEEERARALAGAQAELDRKEREDANRLLTLRRSITIKRNPVAAVEPESEVGNQTPALVTSATAPPSTPIPAHGDRGIDPSNFRRTKTMKPASAAPSTAQTVGRISVCHVDGRRSDFEVLFQGVSPEPPCVSVLSIADKIATSFNLGNSVRAINLFKDKKHFSLQRSSSLSWKDF